MTVVKNRDCEGGKEFWDNVEKVAANKSLGGNSESAARKPLTVQYHHPVKDSQGKRLSTANIIWAERDRGSSYYLISKFAMKGGTFPANHPCAPFDCSAPSMSAQFGGSKRLNAFRERGYWASCFPEGDGITLKWWEDVPNSGEDKTAAQVMTDIRECFGWNVEEVR